MKIHFVLWMCLLLLPLAAQTADAPQAEMDRIRAEAAATVRHISDIANAQIADIQAKIQFARTGSVAASPAPAELAGAAFPAPECKEADSALLKSVRKDGKTYRPSDLRSDDFDRQYERHKSCVAAYIQQAFAEIRQIEDTANAQIKRTADEANGRVESLTVARNAASAAGPPSADQARAVQGPRLSANGGLGVEGVTVEGQRLRRSQDTPKGEGDPDAISCRTPQQLADSRLLGPEICKRNRDWALLYKAGSDISSDGRSVVPTEQSRTTNKAALTCFHGTFGGVYEEHITNEICY
jgi:hypothetical protein